MVNEPALTQDERYQRVLYGESWFSGIVRFCSITCVCNSCLDSDAKVYAFKPVVIRFDQQPELALKG